MVTCGILLKIVFFIDEPTIHLWYFEKLIFWTMQKTAEFGIINEGIVGIKTRHLCYRMVVIGLI
jgi:hypothetical protein